MIYFVVFTHVIIEMLLTLSYLIALGNNILKKCTYGLSDLNIFLLILFLIGKVIFG